MNLFEGRKPPPEQWVPPPPLTEREQMIRAIYVACVARLFEPHGTSDTDTLTLARALVLAGVATDTFFDEWKP